MDEDKKKEHKDVSRLWRVFRTARQMCADRGYEFAAGEVDMPLDEFRSKYVNANGEVDRNSLSFSARPSEEMLTKYTDPPTAKNPNPKPTIGSVWVEFSPHDAIGTKELRNFLIELASNKHHTGIFVAREPITSMGHKFLAEAASQQIEGGVETFNEQDLLVNITRHELVPKHVLLSKQEKIELLDRYRLKETQLPRIQVTDPVARYLGLKRGQVVKIIRRSETAGRYASYRWVI